MNVLSGVSPSGPAHPQVNLLAVLHAMRSGGLRAILDGFLGHDAFVSVHNRGIGDASSVLVGIFGDRVGLVVARHR